MRLNRLCFAADDAKEWIGSWRKIKGFKMSIQVITIFVVIVGLAQGIIMMIVGGLSFANRKCEQRKFFAKRLRNKISNFGCKLQRY